MMKSFKRFALVTSATFAIIFTNASMAAVDIAGAGASFPAPLYSKWMEGYKKDTWAFARYQQLQSDSGVYQLIKERADFAATDAPFPTEYLDKNDLFQFPTIFGGVVPVFHLEGISSNQLKMSGEVLAEIFMGKIKKWNDPKIVIQNAGISLPNKSIIVFNRSGGSGTTFIFTNYLSKVSSSWKDEVGAGQKVNWMTGRSGKDNDTIAQFVRRANGSISYVGYAHAVRHKLPIIQLKNRDGNFVEAGAQSFWAAIEHSQWDANNGFNTSLTDQPGKNSWPITGASYAVINKIQESASIGRSIFSFFDWGYTNGKESATELGYLPLPDSLVHTIREAWSTQVKNLQGDAVWE